MIDGMHPHPDIGPSVVRGSDGRAWLSVPFKFDDGQVLCAEWPLDVGRATLLAEEMVGAVAAMLRKHVRHSHDFGAKSDGQKS